MLDWSTDDRLWLVTREQGVSRLALVDTEPLVVLNSLGVRLSDVLSADRILIIEGPSDEEVLATWFPGVLRNPRVSVIHGTGGDDARLASLLTTWLDRADQLKRRVLYLRDRDELPVDVLDRLGSSNVVHVLAQRELENYLLDADALAVVLGELVPDGVARPKPAEVTAAINTAAEALRPAIVVNRVARQLPNVRLMEHKLRRQLARDHVDLATFTAAVLERLPDAQGLGQRISDWWQEARDDVMKQSGDDLLKIAPGADILERVFMHFVSQHFKKRDHGRAIAREMSQPPVELKRVLDEFLRTE